jgi:hypothetical protein
VDSVLHQFFREHLWILPVAIGVIYLVGRTIVRRLRDREEAIRQRRGAEDDAPLVGPHGFARARRQFFLTLALLVVIVIVSVLTNL